MPMDIIFSGFNFTAASVVCITAMINHVFTSFSAVQIYELNFNILICTELFYSHILDMKRGSLHTTSLRRVHLLDTDELKMAVYGPEKFPWLSTRNGPVVR